MVLLIIYWFFNVRQQLYSCEIYLGELSKPHSISRLEHCVPLVRKALDKNFANSFFKLASEDKNDESFLASWCKVSTHLYAGWYIHWVSVVKWIVCAVKASNTRGSLGSLQYTQKSKSSLRPICAIQSFVSHLYSRKKRPKLWTSLQIDDSSNYSSW